MIGVEEWTICSNIMGSISCPRLSSTYAILQSIKTNKEKKIQQKKKLQIIITITIKRIKDKKEDIIFRDTKLISFFTDC